MSELVALAVAEFAIDGLVWGFAGFFVFRLLGGQRRWWIGILGTSVLALAAEALVFLPLVQLLDLQIGNADIADVLGTERMVDVVTLDPLSDVPIGVLAVAVGFLVAGFFDERRARRLAAMASREDAR